MVTADHLYLFVNGHKEQSSCSRKVLEILVKDKEDNILSTTRENITLQNEDIQDYSAVLLALRKATGLGANHITLFLNNDNLCAQLQNDTISDDEVLSCFHKEAKKLLSAFKSATVKKPDINAEFLEIYV